MSWFEQLKMIPSSKTTLAFVIVNAAATEKAISEIKERNNRLQVRGNTIDNDDLKDIIRQAEAGTIDLQKLKDLYGQPPYGDQTLEQMQENIQKLKEAASFMTLTDVRVLLREALEAKKETDEKKVDEILQNIEQNANLGGKTLQRNRDIRDILDILREKTGQSTIMFENPPSNEQLLSEFAEAIGGELKEGSILVDITSESELIAMMVPKRDKKTKKIIDDDNTLQQKEQVKTSYNKIMRNPDGSKTNTKMLFVSGNESVEIDDLVRQKKIFISGSTKLTLIEPFTGESVLRYIKAVDKVTGSVESFRPKKVPNGASFPNIVFLDKSSNNSLNLNSFAKILLTNDFDDKNWAKLFFEAIRKQGVVTTKQAREMIINDIYEAITSPELKTSTDRGLSIRPFIGANGIKDIGSKDRKQITAEIRKKIKESDRLEDTIEAKTQEREAEQLSFLTDSFTIKEATAYQKYLEEIGYEQGEDYTIEYLKNDINTSGVAPKLKDGKKQYDDSGQMITVEVDGKEQANHARITVEGELITPETAYKEGVKGKSKTAPVKITEEKLAGLKKKLISARQERAKLSPDKTESIERAQEKIKNLEKDIEAAERQLSEKGEGIDISAQTDTLREQLMNMSDFSNFLKITAKKLKDKGGLLSFKNTVVRATALESITPENSLAFFIQVDELVGDGKVEEAFKTIDSDPESQDAATAANELNDNMPTILENMQESIIGGFKLRLEDFANNPASFPDNQVILAKRQFVSRVKILTEGE